MILFDYLPLKNTLLKAQVLFSYKKKLFIFLVVVVAFFFFQNWQRMCTGLEKLTADGIEFEGQLQYVSDAVMAFAHAFK